MRAAIRTATLALALVAAGCVPGRSVALVTVSGVVLDIDHFSVDITNGGESSTGNSFGPTRRPFSVPPAQSFALGFDTGRAGDFTITVTAVDAAGAPLATGHGSGTIVPGAPVDVRIALSDGTSGDLGPGPDDAGASDAATDGGAADLEPAPPPDLAKIKCPMVMIVADASGSMGSDPMNGNAMPNKWAILQWGVQQLVINHGDEAQYGLEVFTSPGGNDAMCYPDTRIDVEPAANQSTAILNTLAQRTPNASSNVGEAVERAAADPRMADPSRDHYIFLITDGNPNCNSGDLSMMGQFSKTQTQAAAAQKPSVHVIFGFDGNLLDPALDGMAKLGLEPVPNCGPSPCYYRLMNKTDLQAALDAAMLRVGGAPGCDPN